MHNGNSLKLPHGQSTKYQFTLVQGRLLKQQEPYMH